MSDHRIELAESYYQQGRYDLAIDLLKKLLSEEPDEAYFHGLLAGCLLGKARLHAAEHELGIALALAPNHSYLYLIKARLSYLKKSFRDTLDDCDEASRLDPTNIDALLLKSSVLQTMGQLNEALTCIESAANLAPDSISVTIAFGDYYLNTGELDKSEAYALEALKKDAQNESANILMGNIQLGKGNTEEAEYHAKFVILNNPNATDALRLFSNIKMRKNLFAGLWWRVNSKIAQLSNIKGSLVLILAFLFFNLLSQIVKDLGYPGASTFISLFWLVVVIYSWLMIPYYHKTLKKELEKFSFNRNF